MKIKYQHSLIRVKMTIYATPNLRKILQNYFKTGVKLCFNGILHEMTTMIVAGSEKTLETSLKINFVKIK